MRGRVNGSGGGSKINGIINEYLVASGGNISAGDFVKFVNEYNEYGGAPTLLDYSKYNHLSAIELDEERVLLSMLISSQAHIAVCKIVGTNIILGDITKIANNSFSAKTVLLDNNRVFALYHDSSNYLCCCLWAIDDLQINIGTPLRISNITNNTQNTLTKISENKIFIAYDSFTSGSTNRPLFVVVAQISSENITLGEIKNIGNTSSYLGEYLNSTLLSENKVLLLHVNDRTYGYLTGTVCNINDTSISYGTSTILENDASYNGSYIVPLDNNKVFIGSKFNSKDIFFYCSVTNTNINIISNIETSIYKLTHSRSFIKMSNNEIILLHAINNTNEDSKLYKTIFTIDNDNIEVSEEIKISDVACSGNYVSGILLNNKLVVFNVGASNKNLYATIYGSFSNGVHQLETSKDKIFGVAKSKGVDGDTIKVIVPNIESEEI